MEQMCSPKDELRRQMRIAVKKYSGKERQDASASVCTEILSLTRTQHPQPCPILLFWPLPDEVDIRPAVKKLYEMGYMVYLPVVEGNNMEIRLFEGENAMREGAFRIMEPAGPVLNEPEMLRAAFVPGMAFSPDGRRLGRGKGYYDRFLPKISCHAYGVCFPCQLMDDIPTEEHDISLSKVITGVVALPE